VNHLTPAAVRLARRAWARWTAIAHVIGTFQARVLLSVFYFVVVPPFALIVRLGRDPLRLRPGSDETGWIDRPPPDTSAATASRQF
jgi:hypothetical protein